MTNRSYRWLFVTLALVGLTADQASKYGIFRSLGNNGRGGEVVVVPGFFNMMVRFDYTAEMCDCPLARFNGPVPPYVNHGALFGIFGEHQDRANLFFMCVSILAAIVITWWAMRRATRHDGLLLAALGLILAGTLGNLYDRAVFGGVRDFLDWYIGDKHWPTFNVADCCLVSGAGLLLIQALFVKPLAKDETGKPAENVAQELKEAGVV